MFIFKEVLADYTSKTAPNGHSLWMQLLWVYLIAPNPTVLFIYVPIQTKMGLVTEDNFSLNIGSTSKCSRAQSANIQRFACSCTFSSWMNWILYGCNFKSSCKICHVEVAEIPSSCERREIDCFVFLTMNNCFLCRTSVSWEKITQRTESLSKAVLILLISLKYLDTLFDGITFHHCLPDTTKREDCEVKTAWKCHIAPDLPNTSK